MREVKIIRLKILRFAAILSTCTLASPIFGKTLSNDIGLGVGTAHFYSSTGNQTGGNRKLQGRFHFDRFIGERFFVGALADLTLYFCPVCDNPPGDAIKTISLVGGPIFRVKPFLFQAGAGLGVASGEDERMEVGHYVREGFTSLNIPILSKAMYVHEFRNFGLGIGIGMRYHLNFKNNAWVVSIPVSVSY